MIKNKLTKKIMSDFKKDGFKRDSFKKDGFKRDDFKGFNPKDYVDTAKDLAKVLSEKNLSEIEIGFKDAYIRLSRNHSGFETKTISSPRPTLSIQPQTTEQEIEKIIPSAKEHSVTSPCVGTVYLAPSPDAEPFVKPGTRVEKGQNVLIVEAMKVMNNISAPIAGTVKSILVHNEQPVEFGQKLILIESD